MKILLLTLSSIILISDCIERKLLPKVPIYAMTLLKAEPGQTANGKVEMVSYRGGLTYIKATIKDLSPGSHGLHIH